jgi:uncharacterized protein
MTKIPQELQEFIQGKMAWVSTAAPDGTPNATPKGTLRVVDDEHLAFADLFSCKTRANLQANPKVAVTVIDEKSKKGYQFKGSAEMLSGGPLFDQFAEQLKNRSMPPLNYVVKIAVEAIFDQSVGADASRRIA